MAREDTDLEQLTSMLQRCLGRIDEEAFRIQANGADGLDLGETDRLEAATEELEELIGSLVVAETADEEADVNAVLEEAAAARLQHLDVPIVQRLDLCQEAARVAAPTAMVTVAVQRALGLAVSPLEPGGQLRLGTRVEQGAVVVEIESLGCDLDDHLPARAETLCDFLDNLGGNCTVHREQDDLYIVLELPQVLAAGPRDRA